MKKKGEGWRRVAATAVFCGVWAGNGEGLFWGTMGEMEEIAKIETRAGTASVEKRGLTLEGNARFWGNGGTLTVPAAETKLNLGDLRPGDLLATRWGEEAKNGTPGFWNHLAIVGTDARRVVEAQKTADGVVIASTIDFLARYSEVCVFRFFDSETARRAAQFAENRVAVETILTPPLYPGDDGKRKEKRKNVKKVEFNGVKGLRDGGKEEDCVGWAEEERRRSGPRYSWRASLTPVLRKDASTENCVSLVRRAFWEATAVDYRWKTPDDLARWDKTGDFAKIGRF